MPTPEFQEFFARIHGGDEAAVEAMLREKVPFLRRVIRMRLLDGRFRSPSIDSSPSSRASAG
jgi:hypothetical protein